MSEHMKRFLRRTFIGLLVFTNLAAMDRDLDFEVVSKSADVACDVKIINQSGYHLTVKVRYSNSLEQNIPLSNGALAIVSLKGAPLQLVFASVETEKGWTTTWKRDLIQEFLHAMRQYQQGKETRLIIGVQKNLIGASIGLMVTSEYFPSSSLAAITKRGHQPQPRLFQQTLAEAIKEDYLPGVAQTEPQQDLSIPTKTSNIARPVSTKIQSAQIYPTTHIQQVPTVIVGVSERQGRRKTMEDAYCMYDANNYKIVGIFDGHGGRESADFTAKNLHKLILESGMTGMPAKITDAFEKTHNAILKNNIQDGTTAVLAVIHDNQLNIAWLSDARAVLERNGTVQYATEDHDLHNPKEIQAIWNRGGTVDILSSVPGGRAGYTGVLTSIDRQELAKYKKGGFPQLRVGGLNMSRSLGDVRTSKMLSHLPDIKTIDLSPENNFLILACDGVWDALPNEDAVEIVKDALANPENVKNGDRQLSVSEPITEYGDERAQLAARALIDAAYIRGSTDNISAAVVVFSWPLQKAGGEMVGAKALPLESVNEFPAVQEAGGSIGELLKSQRVQAKYHSFIKEFASEKADDNRFKNLSPVQKALFCVWGGIAKYYGLSASLKSGYVFLENQYSNDDDQQKFFKGNIAMENFSEYRVNDWYNEVVQNRGNPEKTLQYLTGTYKIHLMPVGSMIPELIKLLELVKNNQSVQDAIFTIKLFYLLDDQKLQSKAALDEKDAMPKVVVYIGNTDEKGTADFRIGRNNAQRVLDVLCNEFKDTPGLDLKPRWNRKVTSLIYYAQGNGDDKHGDSYEPENKQVFERPGLAHFRADISGKTENYALTIPAIISTQQTQSLTPQEALKQQILNLAKDAGLVLGYGGVVKKIQTVLDKNGISQGSLKEIYELVRTNESYPSFIEPSKEDLERNEREMKAYSDLKKLLAEKIR